MMDNLDLVTTEHPKKEHGIVVESATLTRALLLIGPDKNRKGKIVKLTQPHRPRKRVKFDIKDVCA